MIILGLILLVLAVLAIVAVVTGNSWELGATGHDLSVFGISLTHVSVSSLFLAGLATGFVGLLGLVLIVVGSRRSARRHREARSERKSLKQQQKDATTGQTSLSSGTPAAGKAADAPQGRPKDTGAGDRGGGTSG